MRKEIINILVDNLGLTDYVKVVKYLAYLEVMNECREEALEYIKNKWNSKNTTPIENYSVGSWEIELYKILKGE